MRDGRTRRVAKTTNGEDFLATHRASLTVLSGPAAGTEFELDQARMVVGRSRDAGVRIEDASVSHEHAALELGLAGFGIRDLGSTNGVRVNGGAVDSTALKHGDRLEVGAVELQYVVEARSTGSGRAWDIDLELDQ